MKGCLTALVIFFALGCFIIAAPFVKVIVVAGIIAAIIAIIKQNNKNNKQTHQKNTQGASSNKIVMANQPFITKSKKINKSSFFVHPDLLNLVWIKNGPYRNYQINKSDSSIYSHYGININISWYTEEPSLIDMELPVSKPRILPDRPPYYPRYETLSNEQRWMYWHFLSDPYNSQNNIGYAFIFYYGLERHLLLGDFDNAFNLILKMRDFYSNKSFQSYSSKALILTAVIHNRPDMALKYIESIDKDFELSVQPDLYILCKFILDLKLHPDEITSFHRYFNFDNNRYIKNENTLFVKTLTKKMNNIYGKNFVQFSDFFDSLNDLPMTGIQIFANMSLINKTVNIPLLSSNKQFIRTIQQLLMNTHETVKHILAEQRKISNFKTESVENKQTGQKKAVKTEYKKPEPQITQVLSSFESLYQNQKYNQISKKYFDLMQKIENDWSVMYNLKDFSGIMGQNFIQECEQDIVYFKKMAEIERQYGAESPKNIPSYKRLAMIYEKYGDYEKVIEICTRAFEDKMDERGRMARAIKKLNRQPTEKEMAILSFEANL